MRAALVVFFAVVGCSKSEAPPRIDRAPDVPAPPSAPMPMPMSQPEAVTTATRYSFDRTHSPIDASVVARLRAIAANNRQLSDDAFAKVGDSMTASGDFLYCFEKPELPALAEHAALKATIERFRPSGSFRRDSEAAKIGWSAWQATSGSPSPLERELAASKARFALVQYGTNDIENAQIHHFADKLYDAIDWLADKGVIPILFTIPPRRDREAAAVWVPRYNAVIRGIAQARQVPLVDYHREMLRLPGSGLAKDGIHPSTYHGERGRNACDFGPRGLDHGYNLRNLLALEALERARRALSGEALDPPSAASSERSVGELPFVDAPSFRGSSKPAPGPCGIDPKRVAVEYRLRLERAISLRAIGFDRRGEVDLRLATGETCKRDARVIEARLGPGEHRILLDAPSPDAETLLVLLAE